MSLSQNKRIGRPTIITPDTVRKVIVARRRGLSIRQACATSGISHETYYYHTRHNREFTYILEQSQDSIKERARLGVVDAIMQGDLATCKWYLERKDPEFRKGGK
ncbi:MAG: hypothetical protein QG623_372 [Patescibacteria group bacterium]|nr:hypothetical protein [Patescibacteria group bacterium]